MWEYPSVPLSDEREIFSFNFEDSVKPRKEVINQEIDFDMKHNGLLNGMAMWYEVDYSQDGLDDDLKVNTGLLEAPQPATHLDWNKNFRQAVHIFDQKLTIEEANRAEFKVKCRVNFDLKAGKFTVDFKTLTTSSK